MIKRFGYFNMCELLNNTQTESMFIKIHLQYNSEIPWCSLTYLFQLPSRCVLHNQYNIIIIHERPLESNNIPMVKLI